MNASPLLPALFAAILVLGMVVGFLVLYRVYPAALRGSREKKMGRLASAGLVSFMVIGGTLYRLHAPTSWGSFALAFGSGIAAMLCGLLYLGIVKLVKKCRGNHDNAA